MVQQQSTNITSLLKNQNKMYLKILILCLNIVPLLKKTSRKLNDTPFLEGHSTITASFGLFFAYPTQNKTP